MYFNFILFLDGEVEDSIILVQLDHAPGNQGIDPNDTEGKIKNFDSARYNLKQVFFTTHINVNSEL